MRNSGSAICVGVLALFAAPVFADAPRVVTDIPAVHSLVAQVMGDRGEPVLLTERGADPHSMQLRPSQAAALAEADLIFWIGPEMTPWLDRAMAGMELKAHVIGLLSAEGTFRQDFGATGAHGLEDHDHAKAEAGHGHGHGHSHRHSHGHSHGHAHDHSHGHAHGAKGGQAHGDAAKASDHGDHDHAHAGTDPHAWLDPANARTWLALIAEELAEHDPGHAEIYAANASAAAERIAALDAALAARLAPLAGKPFVVFHDAYGYFAGHYGLTVAGSIALGDASAPSAARLSALRDALREGGAVCAFPEPQHDTRLVAAVVEDTPVRIGGALDPSGTTLEPGPDLYAALMTGLAETIAACLEQ
jgi:zinc transport system substrate-binding protein